MNIILFYLIGYIIAYYLCRQLRNIASAHKWEDIKASFIISIFSWIAIVILLILLAIESKNSDPPAGL